MEAILHLRQEDDGRKEDEKVTEVDQLEAPTFVTKGGKYELGYKQPLRRTRNPRQQPSSLEED